MLTLSEISKLVNGKLKGDGSVEINSVADLEGAKPGDISFVAEEKYLKKVIKSKAKAFIVKEGLEIKDKPYISVSNPYYAIARILEKTCLKETFSKGIHPSAIISKSARIGKNVAILPYVIIEDNASIGNDTIIYPNCYIGENARVGDSCLIYPEVTIRERVIVGNKVIIHSGAILGSDGFGYAKMEDGTYYKIPQVGTVEIEDDVEIGANVCIDRATFNRTLVKKGAKIDNLVHIAHNCVVEENAILAGQVGLSGSVTIKKGAILAGQVGISDHLEVGENSFILAQSGVSKNIPAGKAYWGYPAQEARTAWKTLAEMKKISSLIEKVKILEAKIKELETRIKP